jgi:hypothetical protein
MHVTLEDLGMAFRKAKVDIYYSTHANLARLAEYENDLANNLSHLQRKLRSKSQKWVMTDEFLGEWFPAAKAITPSLSDSDKDEPIFSSPEEHWSHLCNKLSKRKSDKLTAVFRVMADVSIDFHVVSSLWMLKVGHLYDQRLGKCAYGSRLRRTTSGDVNALALGSFAPYLAPFRNWRDNGINAMKSALTSNKRIVAITADVSSFYHKLDATFMLDSEFNSKLGIELDVELATLHELFITAVTAWAKATPLQKGLPVGLPASAVIANLALFELDQMVERQIVPLYYGRYVDDIILVMENGANFKTAGELWTWIFERSNDSLEWADTQKKNIAYSTDYLRTSEVHFSNEKNKMFLLHGEPGLTLVRSIERQIQERASEWRALPILPESANQISTDLIAATQRDGETVDNLRKADSLTMRRAGFALKLRDFEAYERDLEPNAWREHRHTFFRSVSDHVIEAPHQLFELAVYLPRIILSTPRKLTPDINRGLRAKYPQGDPRCARANSPRARSLRR